MKQQGVDESARETPEYLESKLLLIKRKTLQANASISVNLASADLRAEGT